MTAAIDPEKPHARFFWLHIKKSAGQSTRRALGPLHAQTGPRRKPPPAILDLPQAEWIDALNNYRTPMGEWTHRRGAYAAKVLWPDAWEGMLRLAFAREPVSRAVSMMDYLFHPIADLRRSRCYWSAVRHLPLWRRLALTPATRFDLFLETLVMQESLRAGPNPGAPINLHFATHTNPMWRDVTDDGGPLLIPRLVRLDHFEWGIDQIYADLGISRPDETRGKRIHTRGRPAYRPSPAQVREVEAIFGRDFDLYEQALRP